MHVLINAASAHMGGAVTYLRNVLQWLPAAAPGSRFTVYVPDATRGRLEDLENEVVRIRPYPYASTQGLHRMYFDQVAVPAIMRREGIDGLYSATGFGTFFSPRFQLLAIRNMAYFDPAFHARYRELDRSLRRNTLRRWYSLLSIRRADAVLFPTVAMRDTVRRYLSLDDTSTHVVHYGFDVDGFFRDGDGTPGITDRMEDWKRQGYDLLLNVSTYAVHKNLETVVGALSHLNGRRRVKLLTTTSRDKTTDKAEYDRLHEQAREAGVEDDWIEVGYVPYDELHALYEAADAYVFPSFCESFGHSMVEAMACGLPVAAAGTPVNREVCGSAGTYFDTFDAEDCARAISRVLASDSARKTHERASKDRAARFSWEEHTERLVDIFRSAVQA